MLIDLGIYYLIRINIRKIQYISTKPRKEIIKDDPKELYAYIADKGFIYHVIVYWTVSYLCNVV